GGEVRDTRRHALERRAENAGQADKRRLTGKVGQGRPLRDETGNSGAAGQDGNQSLWTFHEDASTALLNQRNIANELEGVAETLLGVQQNGSALERLTVPDGLRVRSPATGSGLPAPFVFGPSLFEVAC